MQTRGASPSSKNSTRITRERLFLSRQVAKVLQEATKLYTKEELIMGDRSPKAVQKQASQKKAKTDSADQKKQQDLAAKAKLAVGKKK